MSSTDLYVLLKKDYVYIALSQYIGGFYNGKRVHLSISYRKPYEFE